MFDAGLPVHFLVDAARRCAEHQDIVVVVRHKGDPDRGVIHLVINHLDHTASLWSQQRDSEGRLTLVELKDSVAETEAEQWVTQIAKTDGDAWILEVEDPQNRNPFELL